MSCVNDRKIQGSRQWHPWRFRYLSARVALLVTLLWYTFAGSAAVKAHGGVVIDSGFTTHFEWLVSINPYPITTGEATITLLVFDLTTYAPVNDLQITFYLAAPGTTRPCCNPADLSAPIDLVIDPQLYPGDYSAVITFNQPGDWAMQFVVEGGDRSFTVVVPVQVAEATLVPAAPRAGTPDSAATATVFAQNVQQARQQNSPLAVQISPLAPSPLAITTPALSGLAGLNWWLWGVAAIIPIVIGWLLLRSPQREADDTVPAPDELDNGNAQ